MKRNMKLPQVILWMLLIVLTPCITALRGSKLYVHKRRYYNSDKKTAEKYGTSTSQLRFSLPNWLSSPDTRGIRSAILGISLLLGPTSNNQPAYGKEYPVFEEVWSIVQKNFFDPSFNSQNWDKIHEESIRKLDSGKTSEQKQIKEMLQTLNDKYSRLLDKKTYESLWKYDAIGVGLLFQSDSGSGKLYVSAPPLEGSSGAAAGIAEGTIIYEVNGQSAEKLSAIQLLDLLSNDPSDKLNMVIGDKSGNPETKRSITLKRQMLEKTKNPVVSFIQYIKDKNGDQKKVGYISMHEFNSLSVPGMKEALEKLVNQQNVDLVALDLRGNPGGGFQFAMNIGGMFLDNSKVMVTAAGRGYEQTEFKASYPEGILFDRPLVLVMDGLSASASEVLAAGLHDNCRATVIGEKSFGKGKIQAVFGLKDGEGLALTVAQYLSPSGRVIQSTGIPPDLVVSVTNPIVNSLIGSPAITAVDLNGIDLDQAFDTMRQTCQTQFQKITDNELQIKDTSSGSTSSESQ